MLEELKPGLRVEGLVPAEIIAVIAAQWHGSRALELTYKTAAGSLGQQVVFREDQDNLSQHCPERQPCLRCRPWPLTPGTAWGAWARAGGALAGRGCHRAGRS